MRTISLRLDEVSAARLHGLCQRLGLSQTDVVKAGIQLLSSQSASPAALAEELGLVGCFNSQAEGHPPSTTGRDHAALLRTKLRNQKRQQP